MAQFPPNPRIGLGIVCAIAGGTAGYFLFFWIARQGFYALILPSTLLGLAGGAGVRLRSNSFAIACGAAGLCSPYSPNGVSRRSSWTQDSGTSLQTFLDSSRSRWS